MNGGHRGVLCLAVVASMTGLVIFDPILHARGEERMDDGNISPGRNEDPSIWGDDESRESRCFLDLTQTADPTQTDGGRQRCRPNVFLIGVSKCGRSFPLGSRRPLRSQHAFASPNTIGTRMVVKSDRSAASTSEFR